MFRSPLLPWGLALSCALGCAYPRRTTPLTNAAQAVVPPGEVPPDMWRFVLVSADVPPTQRSGLPWDEGGGGPDPYLVLSAEDRQIWQSATLDDTTNPQWNQSPPKNLAIPRNQRLRIELWDDDGVSADPIGIYEGRALGDAIMDADTLLKLEGGATLTVRVEHPEPHAGTGIAQYEVRKHALLVLEVLPNSPASRAHIVPGDRITEIDGRTIDELGEQKAASALVLAQQNQSELTLENKGQVRRVKLDKGYVWLAM